MKRRPRQRSDWVRGAKLPFPGTSRLAMGGGQCPAPVTVAGAGRGVVTMGAMSVLIFLFLLLPGAVQVPAGQAPAVPSPAPGNPVAVISTSLGDITVELFKDKAPVSVENFLQYVSAGFYTGTIFHRVVAGFVIQGGGYTADMTEKPTNPPIQNEATNGLKNTRGTLAMARLRTLRSATSQFYINLSNNSSLDHRGYAPDDFGYAVFGRVLSGMDVVDKIGAVPVKGSVPVEPVTIKGVQITALPKWP
jgi:peptidyl-prolyl cis-trans isomerase A (cyclophilin A)